MRYVLGNVAASHRGAILVSRLNTNHFEAFTFEHQETDGIKEQANVTSGNDNIDVAGLSDFISRLAAFEHCYLAYYLVITFNHRNTSQPYA